MADIKPKVKVRVGFATSKREEEIEPEVEILETIKPDVKAEAIVTSQRAVKMSDLCAKNYVFKHAIERKAAKAKQAAESESLWTADAASATQTGSSGSSSQVPGSSSATTATTNSSSSGAKRSRHEHVDAPAEAQGPQVEIRDGKIVLKESSLIVQETAVVTEGEFEEIVEGTHATATYRSFQRKQRHDRWGLEETRHFFAALRQCGTEFSLMQSFFPGRTRRQLKLKFMREEREHPELVHETLKMAQPLDLQPFHVQFTAHPSEITDEQREERASRRSTQEYELIPNLPSIFNCDDEESTLVDI